jgi:hypothetical protein
MGRWRYHLWLAELTKLYTIGARENSEFGRLVKLAMLVHDQGADALPKHTTVYRVALHPDRDDIEVVSIGMERGDTAPDTVYLNFSCLPQWMQGRLHVMNLLDDTAPTEHVEGIGRRISKYVFWLEIPTKEDGNG